MKVNEAERIVIAKPLPSRPTCSNFRSFSELLAGAINSSPSNNECSETAVTAIRPKTLRLKPAANLAPVGVVSQAETSGAAICCPSDKVDKVSNTDSKSTVVYKPLAKVVKTTFSLSPNLRNSNTSVLAPVEARVQPPNQLRYHLRTDHSSNLHQNVSAQTEREKTNEPSKMASENIEDDQKTMPLTSNVDRPSYDGYNWRKYGQKQVKGSEYPRSYYKCTHPNCPVKKKVERSLDGQIAEIVYNGEHNHSKPQPPKRNTSTGQGQGFVSGGTGQETNNPSLSNQINDRNEGFEGRVENQNEVGGLDRSTYLGKAPLSYDPVAAENSCALSEECEEGSKGLEAEDDEPKSKRRKNETESGISGQGVQEPPVVVQSSTDSEVIGDGFRWRKYGQKVVKGNPYPRSYYRCTNLKCSVRKHVERASDDPTAFITTYEGKHNHDVPTKSTNPATCEPDSQAATSKDKP
ncbi:WRKY transcription factor 44-like [Actinidia eriantha]|uniref:WRKY transcription factor 44-like n=1 Tax=Actinidia eriantha TaxID=165200 RepID=UPI00258D0ED3|nr:WRKY transcription factor 44-like [Actinidia eriantha]